MDLISLYLERDILPEEKSKAKKVQRKEIGRCKGKVGSRLFNSKPKTTWTRINRMDFGLGGLARAITFPTLGKRDMRDTVGERIDEHETKRGKVINEEGLSKEISAGVDSHPCRKQLGC